MYFNDAKPRKLGERLCGGKLLKKVSKSVEQLKRHDPDVIVSKEPTKHLFVSNSSVLCGVSLEELEEVFKLYDENCQFIVYPNKRAYSFVSFSTVDAASRAFDDIHGLVPPQLVNSHLPFVIQYVENPPLAKNANNVLRPAGLEVLDNFVSEEEEKSLMHLLLNHPNLNSLKFRAVVHFGHVFDYGSNSASTAAEPVPEEIKKVVQKLVKQHHMPFYPDQVTANVYEPGHGIPSHYDTHSAFEDPIVSLSLGSDVVMEFKDGANSARVAPILLPRRSLCLIKEESRYRWKHGIVNRKYDVDPLSNRVVARRLRVSLTFRKIRTKPCECRWKEFCDWDRGGDMGIPQNEGGAKRLEDEYVSDVYERISSHFDETRHSNWRAVQQFIDALPRYSLLYDVGCGNGKYLLTKDDLLKIGCDYCSGLCSIAYKKDCLVARADGLALPFRENMADGVICIAVLHHMSSMERRTVLMEEIVRMLKAGGRACITVWSMDQSDSEYAKMRSNKEENTVDSASNGGDRLLVHDGKEFAQQDVLVPWTINRQNETFLRFYHVFREGEMEELVKNVKGCRLISVEKEQGNYVVIIEKL